MDAIKDVTKEKALILGKLILYRKDLLRAISWIDFLPTSELQETDKRARDNLIKLINQLTRDDN